MKIVVTMVGSTIVFEATNEEMAAFLAAVTNGDKWLHVTDTGDNSQQYLIQASQVQSIHIHE